MWNTLARWIPFQTLHLHLDRASQAQVIFLHDNFYPFDNNFTGVACRSRRHTRNKVDKGGPTPGCTSPSSPTPIWTCKTILLSCQKVTCPVAELWENCSHYVMSESVHVEISGGPKGDWTFVLHILGQILAHNSILHATAGSKFLRVQVASFSITLHRMRQLSASTQLAMTIGSCRLHSAKGFSLSPVVDWSYVKSTVKLMVIYMWDYNVRSIRH